MAYLSVFVVVIALGCLLMIQLGRKKAKTLQELWAKVDQSFAIQCCALCANWDEKEWHQICTPRGIMHMICQACLLGKIIVESRKINPDLCPMGSRIAFEAESQIKLDAIRSVAEIILKSFLPRLTLVHGRAAVREFSDMFACAELMFAEFDYTSPVS
jgi:hypothetical protein